jgi:hypothetical protein
MAGPRRIKPLPSLPPPRATTPPRQPLTWPIWYPLLSCLGPVNGALAWRSGPTCHSLPYKRTSRFSRAGAPVHVAPEPTCQPLSPPRHPLSMDGPRSIKPLPSHPPRATTHPVNRFAPLSPRQSSLSAPPSSPEHRPKVSSMASGVRFPFPLPLLSPEGVRGGSSRSCRALSTPCHRPTPLPLRFLARR